MSDPHVRATAPPAALPTEDRLLRLPAVLELTGLGKTMIYRMVRERRFPQPYKPGGAASRWSEREIREWREQVAAARAS